MKRRLTLCLFVYVLLRCALFISGCATIDSSTTCPSGTIGTSWGLNGSQVGNQLIAMGAAAAKVAGFMATAPGANQPAPTTITMHYSYVPIFGQDGGSTTCVMPGGIAAGGGTTINNSQGGVINMPHP